jgi:hypothetical protein
MEELRPNYRFKLKGAIHSARYKSLLEFAKAINSCESTVSMVVNGWRFPSPQIQRKMAEAMGITIRELRELL